MTRKNARARVRISADGTSTNVNFEPIGNEYKLEPGEVIFLDVPLDDLRELEVIAYDRGVAFWLPYHGGQFVLDKDGTIITEL